MVSCFSRKGAFSVKNFLFLRKLFFILLGNTLLAFAVTAFVLPSGLISGGSTGVALLALHWLGVPVEVTAAAVNLVAFAVGAVFLGRRFALTTLISTVYYPFALSLLQRLPQLSGLTGDRLLCALYAGGLMGLGVGLVLREGASTGGLDIPPLILNQKFGVPVSVCLYAMDTTILLGQVFISGSEEVLYGILAVLLCSLLVDKVLLSGKRQVQVQIVSEKYEEINRAIQTSLERGSTLLRAQTGYLRQETLVVFTAVSSRELPRLNRLVLSIDSAAFMVISQVTEVKGRGFSLGKFA